MRAVDGLGWLEGDITRQRFLCLAAGGGRQGPLYAAAGACVTVVDISAGMLELDRRVAAERGLQLRLVQSSMEDLSMFAEGEFDVVIAPYHDQGLIPVKLIAHGESTNVTLGLPYIRTSPDHGTAFSIAGRGVADPAGMHSAMKCALDLARRR